MTTYSSKIEDIKTSGGVDFSSKTSVNKIKLHVDLDTEINEEILLAKANSLEERYTDQSPKLQSNINMYASSAAPFTKEHMSKSYICNAGLTNIPTESETKPYPVCLQRKIVKSNNQYHLSQHINKAPRPEPSFVTQPSSGNEHILSKQKDTLPHSNSSSSLDFLAEGERMVSELCNISTDSPLGDQSASLSGSKVTVELMCDMFNSTIKNNNRPIISNRCPNKGESIICDETVPLEIIQLAVEACTAAENIAIANKNRPCFKNIQTICEKTRSNVQKPDSAVANLHSQGIPWVIKNFIFSFVRILDGWKGIKELMCEKHESFMRIENKYYNPQIRECFLEWQLSTKNMLHHIYKTFKALDDGFQAEQQRFKQTCTGINFTGIQNQNKSQNKPLRLPIVNHPENNTPLNQWSVSNHNLNYGLPSVQVPNVQWGSHPQIVQNTSFPKPIFNDRVDSDVYNVNGVYNINAALPLTGVIDTKDRNDIKVCNDMMNDITKSSTNWYHQQCRDFQLNYRNHANTPVNKSALNCDSLANNISGDSSFIKGSCLSHTIPDPEGKFCNKMELRDPGMNHINFWIHNNAPTNNVHYGCYDTSKNTNPNIFATNSCGIFSHLPNISPIGNNIKLPCQLDSDIDENDQANVYMKPGSYNVPIKPSEIPQTPDFSNVETLTVHNSLISKREIPILMSLPTPMEPAPLLQKTTLPYQNDSVAIDKNHISENILFSQQVNELNSLCLDKEWEAAKQLAPKLLNTIHGKCISKSDAQRLCDALELNQANSNVADHSQTCFLIPNGNLYWNKVSQDFYGGKCHSGDIMNDENFQTESVTEKNNNIAFIKSDSGDKSINENKSTPVEVLKDEISFHSEESMANKTFDPNTGFPIKTITPREYSFFIDKEYASCDTIKKLKKKNNYLTSKYLNKKKRDFMMSGTKKVHGILAELWNMERKQQVKYGLDLSQAPSFYDVVKNPITFNDVSDKIKNSFYTDIDQVAEDFQCIFCNAYTYLKVHPNGELKLQTDNVSDYFEKLFYGEFLNLDKSLRDRSNRKQRARSDSTSVSGDSAMGKVSDIDEKKFGH